MNAPLYACQLLPRSRRQAYAKKHAGRLHRVLIHATGVLQRLKDRSVLDLQLVDDLEAATQVQEILQRANDQLADVLIKRHHAIIDAWARSSSTTSPAAHRGH